MRTLSDALGYAASVGRARAGLRFLMGDGEPLWLDWSEVARRARKASGALLGWGVRPGDRVAIVLPTAPSFFDALLGCVLAGAVPVPLYPPVRLGRLDEYIERTVGMLNAVEARLLVTDGRTAPLLGRVVERADVPVLLAPSLDGPEHLVPSDEDDLALVQFSSGTTARPRPVALTHGQILANARAILGQVARVAPLDGARPPSGVCWLPLYHDMGLIGCVVPGMLAPGELTLLPPERFLARPERWLRAISDYRAVVSPAPDFAYALCADRIADVALRGVDLSSWRLALNGAEPIRAETCRRFAARFAGHGFRAEAITPVYGLSEAALAVTFTEPGAGPRVGAWDRDALGQGQAVPRSPGDDGVRPVELVGVGRPLAGFEVQIRGPGGELPEGAIGRVHVRGPSVMRGYLQARAQPIRDGWLDTGDLGFLHAGELFITGRAKDLIVHRGRNHAPQDLERAVDAVAGVRTGCAVAVADVGEHGERVVLLVEVRQPAPDQAEACAEAVLRACGLRPDRVELLAPGTLPRTSSGKLRRGEALRRYREGSLRPPGRATPLAMAGALADSAGGHLAAWWRRAGRAR